MRTLLSVLCMVACTTAAAQQPGLRTAPYAHTYFRFETAFDSCLVRLTFGEVQRVRRKLAYSVPLRTTDLPPWAAVDPFLGPEAGTQPFGITHYDVLSWYRELAVVRTPCSGDTVNHPTAVWAPADTVVFLVELVDARNQTVLLVLDSLGVVPTRATLPTDVRSGMYPALTYRESRMPSHLNGRQVYLRVRQVRRAEGGHSTVSVTGNWCKRSAYEHHGPALTTAMTSCFRTLLDHCDSVKTATGSLPAIEQRDFTPAETDILHNRFFDQWYDTARTTLGWREKRPGEHAALPASTAHLSFVQSSITDRTANAVIMSSTGSPVTVRLFTAGGEHIALLWSGVTSHVLDPLPLTLPPDLPPGAYRVVLTDEEGLVLDTTTLTAL